MVGKEIVPFNTARLLNDAKDAGNISSLAYEILEPVSDDIEPSRHMIKGDELLLIAVMPDDSYSIKQFGNTQVMRESHNRIIKALDNSRQKRNILFRTQYLNGFVLNNWVPLDYAKPLTEENYKPDLDTPLFDGCVKLLGSAEAEMQKARMAKKRARFGALIVSDGEDTSSERYEAADVKKLVTDIFRRNDPDFPNTFAFMGLPNTRVASYRSIANSMGIQDERTNVSGENVMQIITPTNVSRELRRAVDTWSRGVVVRDQGSR